MSRLLCILVTLPGAMAWKYVNIPGIDGAPYQARDSLTTYPNQAIDNDNSVLCNQCGTGTNTCIMAANLHSDGCPAKGHGLPEKGCLEAAVGEYCQDRPTANNNGGRVNDCPTGGTVKTCQGIGYGGLWFIKLDNDAAPTSTPSAAPSAAPSVTASAAPSATASAAPSVTASAAPSVTASAAPSSAPTMVSEGDPHITGLHGEKFDIHGKDGVIYNLLSDRNVSVNGLIEEHAFNVYNLKVLGAFFTRMGFVLRSNETGKIVTIEYDPHRPPIQYNDEPLVVGTSATLEDISVRLPHMNVLEVNCSRWAFKVTAHEIKYGVLEERYLRDKPDQLDLKIVPLVDPLAHGVAPHGLIGQTADGDDIAVDGAQDNLREMSKNAKKGPGGLKFVYPSAQGEGGIEGKIEDYEVGSEFSTEFKYSRFDAVSAPVRNVAALTGKKHRNTMGYHHASTAGDDVMAAAALA